MNEGRENARDCIGASRPMTPKESIMKLLTEQLFDTYSRKNHDYGDSFSKCIKKFGYTSVLVRLTDKMLRIEQLLGNRPPEVISESVKDTLIDLAAYSLMTVAELTHDEMCRKDSQSAKF